jgi:hypothetical protein
MPVASESPARICVGMKYASVRSANISAATIYGNLDRAGWGPAKERSARDRVYATCPVTAGTAGVCSVAKRGLTLPGRLGYPDAAGHVNERPGLGEGGGREGSEFVHELARPPVREDLACRTI